MKSRLPMLLCVALLVAGCGSGGSDADQPSAPAPAPSSADITLLFMGNSHSSFNNLQGMVAEMVRTAEPEKSVATAEAPGFLFLEERIHHEPTLSLLQSQDWSFVVLQAQKYSTSGQFEYSTAEAKQFIRMARAQQALPILFPEWPRRGVNETERIYELHVSIAQQEPACVAPIGQAWDLSLARHPELKLHADDGNHSNPAGAFLTALILYATMTGKTPLDVPPLGQFPVGESNQALLRAVAAEAVQAWPPRAWCPNDLVP